MCWKPLYLATAISSAAARKTEGSARLLLSPEEARVPLFLPPSFPALTSTIAIIS